MGVGFLTTHLGSRRLPCVGTPKIVIFAHYGVLERARGCESKVNEEFIYRSLTSNYSVPHIHLGVAIDMEDGEIDGTKMTLEEKQNFLLNSTFHYTALQSYRASELDKVVSEKKCSEEHGALCAKPFWAPHYDEGHIQRALRTMLVEHHLSEMLARQHAYEDAVVLVTSADIIPNAKMNLRDVRAAYCKKDAVFFTRNNDGVNGYTNGFFLGHINAVTKMLSTYKQLDAIFRMNHTKVDYERILKLTSEAHGVTRHTLTGFGKHLRDFAKVRASGEVFQQISCAAKQLIDVEICPQLAEQKCF